MAGIRADGTGPELPSVGPGRKYDQGKLRLHKIPPEALSLILEHCKAPILGTTAERYTETLRALSEHQATGCIAALARATQGMLGLAEPDSRVLLPAHALEGVARVLHFGAERAGLDGKGYGWDNWQNVEADRYAGGFYRHLMAIGRGELLDTGPTGSGEKHALNGACCGLFRLWQLGRRGGAL